MGDFLSLYMQKTLSAGGFDIGHANATGNLTLL